MKPPPQSSSSSSSSIIIITTIMTRSILFYVLTTVGILSIPNYQLFWFVLQRSSTDENYNVGDTYSISKQTPQYPISSLRGNNNHNNNNHNYNNNSSTISQSHSETFHILFTLLGRDSQDPKEQQYPGTAKALYETWQVSFKSVLLNAPFHRPLHIHVLCNTAAQHAIEQQILFKNHILDSQWSTPITITTYNVESFHPTWTVFLQTHLHTRQLDDRVSLGGYYRLLAYQIVNLPKQMQQSQQSQQQQQQLQEEEENARNVIVDRILYMDSDVVILTNLNDIIPYIKVGEPLDDNKNSINNNSSNTQTTNISNTILFQGSKSWFCSGFVVLNIQHFDDFWTLLDSIEQPLPSTGDQVIMQWILDHYPNVVAELPQQWNYNLGHGWRNRPHIVQRESEVAAGMIHFQGGTGRRPNQTYWQYPHGLAEYLCRRSQRCNQNMVINTPKVEQTWGLAMYYVNVPWHWVLYFGRSLIDNTTTNEEGNGGYSLQYESWTALPPFSEEVDDYPRGKLVPTETIPLR